MNGRSIYSLRAAAMAARPEGVATCEIGHRSLKHAGGVMDRLVKAGLIFRATLGRRTVRYFSTQKAADRYVKANLAAHQAEQARHKPKTYLGGVKWDRNAPMVITKDTKFTYAPPPPAVLYRTNTHAR